MSFSIEKDWVTKAGLRAVCILGDRHRCGYVAVGRDHPLFGINYHDSLPKTLSDKLEEVMKQPPGKRSAIQLFCFDDKNPRVEILFNVHGGLTYSGGKDYPIKTEGLWWFGFDCGHYGDGTLGEDFFGDCFPVRTLDYVEEECESLATQLTAIKAENKNA